VGAHYGAQGVFFGDLWRVDFGYGLIGGPRAEDTTFDDDISGGGEIGLLGFTRLDNTRATTPKGQSGSVVWVFPPAGIQPPGIRPEAPTFTVAGTLCRFWRAHG
jgi:hypothetical protein